MERHIIPISGKDSLCTAIIMNKLHPKHEYIYFFNDTGLELPPVYLWLQKVEKTLGIKITTVGSNLKNIMYEQGLLPSARIRYCTRLSKIYPMESFLKEYLNDKIFLYLGIRADEERVGYKSLGKLNIIPCYPLKDNNIDLQAVYTIIEKYDLMPPTFFWSSVYEEVLNHIPLSQIENIPSWVKTILFAWRSRPNCFMCFFQRQYEIVGLHEHYPELFDEMSKMETEIGAEGFNFLRKSVSEIISNKDKIKGKRVKKIVKDIINFNQLTLFSVQDEEQFGRSCGLFCGK